MSLAGWLARLCAGFFWRRARSLCWASAEVCDACARRIAAGGAGLAAATLLGLLLALAALAATLAHLGGWA